jgi:hypothetical protein
MNRMISGRGSMTTWRLDNWVFEIDCENCQLAASDRVQGKYDSTQTTEQARRVRGQVGVTARRGSIVR